MPRLRVRGLGQVVGEGGGECGLADVLGVTATVSQVLLVPRVFGLGHGTSVGLIFHVWNGVGGALPKGQS